MLKFTVLDKHVSNTKYCLYYKFSTFLCVRVGQIKYCILDVKKYEFIYVKNEIKVFRKYKFGPHAN